MKIDNKKFKTKSGNIINYYEINNEKPPLLIIHAQGTNAFSYEKVLDKLSKFFHLFLVDCYGHGKSSRNKELYNLETQGNDLIEFIKSIINNKIALLGHSSGGLIASYIASKTDLCDKLFLEDPPLFSSCGENRVNYYNYKDLSTVCHNFINQDEIKDFVYYYFINQYCWNFFPENSRDKIKTKLGDNVLKFRTKHPDKTLRVMFWPKKFMESFNGLNDYDPNFGEAFYNDSFNSNIDYEKLLSNIDCETIFMKAKTVIGEDGLIQCALTDEDLDKVKNLIKNIDVEYFNCGHGIHNEKPKQFIKTLTR